MIKMTNATEGNGSRNGEAVNQKKKEFGKGKNKSG